MPQPDGIDASTGTMGPPLVIVLPTFNDWGPLSALLPLVDRALSDAGLRAAVIVVDDGSTQQRPEDFGARRFQALVSVAVVQLRRNLGHQRAIAIGLAYIERHVAGDAVIVMDADGEDAPGDIPRLVERYRRERGEAIVFAERRKRAETWMFRVLYQGYRLAHRVLTGHGVRVGNFSIIPRSRLSGLVIVSELWSHYAAAVVKSRQPYVTIPTRRAARLGGQSHMNFVSLVVHGMTAISVYGDRVFVRLIVWAALLVVASVVGLCAVVAVRLLTPLAIPGWATFAAGLLVLTLLQALTFMASLTFLGLGSRQLAPFVPARDYELYVARTWTATPDPQGSSR